MATCVPISDQICQRLGLRGPLSGKISQPLMRPSNSPVRAYEGLKQKTWEHANPMSTQICRGLRI